MLSVPVNPVKFRFLKTELAAMVSDPDVMLKEMAFASDNVPVVIVLIFVPPLPVASTTGVPDTEKFVDVDVSQIVKFPDIAFSVS